MAKKRDNKVFNSMEEYRSYVAAREEKSQLKGSKYYRVGADIAKLACKEAGEKEHHKGVSEL